MKSSFHNHSSWSDGAKPIADLWRAAAERGLTQVGISDHFTLHPEGETISWSLPLERLDAYVAEVRQLRATPASVFGPGGAADTPPALRLGLEVDWFPGMREALHARLVDAPWDYLIGSVHFVDEMPIDGRVVHWRSRDEEALREVLRGYWRRIRGLAESGLFDVVGHLDLYKKHALAPAGAEDMPEAEEALDAIAANGLIVELNTAGWHKACRDAYPTPALLERCRAREIPVLISADAHLPEHVDRDFDRAAERLWSAGYRSRVAGFERRVRSETPLAG